MDSTSISNIESPSNSSNCTGDEQQRKLFVGGLNYTTVDEKLNDYFSKYGEINECIIMRDREGRSRGFAFVSFRDRSQLDRFMAERPHIIDGRQIEAKRAMPREEAFKLDGQLTVKKIFVGGIKEDLTEDHLRSYFKKFGNLIECHIMKDKDDKLRGFAFITFDDYDAVDRCILEKPHRINGKELDVRKAIPREQTIRSNQNILRQNTHSEHSHSLTQFYSSPMMISAPPLFPPFTYLTPGNYVSKPMPLMTSTTSCSPSALFLSPDIIRNNFFPHQTYPSPLETTNSSVHRNKSSHEPTTSANEISNCHLSNTIINSSSATNRTKSHTTSAVSSEQHRKLFIGGLAFKTTDETLREYATKFGEVSDSLVMKDTTGQSRCFGFVTFVDPKTVDEFMKQRPHTLDGRQIDPKRAMPRDEANNGDLHLTVKKIFIGGIREGLDGQMLKDYFSRFGEINECLLMHDKDGKPRGFAFLEFDDFDSVDKVILARPHIISDYRVDVKKAVPKDQRQMQVNHHQQQQQQFALQMQAAACNFYYNNVAYNSLNPGSCTLPITSQSLIRSNGNGNGTNDYPSSHLHTTNNNNQTYHLTNTLRSVSTSNNHRQSSHGS